ncbi:MAG: molybdopterin molybdotransferase MoeA [Desulfofustis sp.]|jgi:molybdopterin molybdotransferase|nr:molybdopterin molybdotransferase MoeA [Desulfofustis sp.]
MISVLEAQRILDENVPPADRRNVPIDDAFGSYLSEDIKAPEASPRYTNSAMDGYAVRWRDCAGATPDAPAVLKIIGESQAGVPFDGEVAEHSAVRISTGAMVPDGADTVVRVEDTREADGLVSILTVKREGQDVRSKGEEFAEGQLLFLKGTCVAARELALMAAVGIHTIPVYGKPVVYLLVTGTELVCHDEDSIKPHQIRDSNTIMLTGAIRECGAFLMATSHVQDSLAQTVAAIGEAVDSGAKIIVCSGGVSVGRHDHVREAAKQAGFAELFWQIRQKPGKPLYAGRKENTLIFGLPGNPVSAYMCFRNFVRPVLAKLQGTRYFDRTLTTVVAEQMSNRGNRTLFVRVKIENRPNQLALLKEVGRQGSHMLSSIAHADGYIVLQPGEILQPGSLKEVSLF